MQGTICTFWPVTVMRARSSELQCFLRAAARLWQRDCAREGQQEVDQVPANTYGCCTWQQC